MADDGESAIKFYRQIDFKKCVYMVGDAWNDDKRITSERAWRKIKEISNDKQDVEGRFPKDGNILKIVPEISEAGEKEVRNWLLCDNDDHGYQIMTDDDIVDSSDVIKGLSLLMVMFMKGKILVFHIAKHSRH